MAYKPTALAMQIRGFTMIELIMIVVICPGSSNPLCAQSLSWSNAQ